MKMARLMGLGLCAWGVAACGSSSDGGGGSTITGAAGSAGTAGTGGDGFHPITVIGGSTGVAGTSPSNGGNTGLGTNPFGGFGNGPGSGGSSASSTPGYPSGTVNRCFGDCPLSRCDNSGFSADPLCSSVYAAPIGPTSSYCNAAQNGSYCIQVGSSFDPDFSVSCVNGAATVLKCSLGCGTSGTGMYECL